MNLKKYTFTRFEITLWISSVILIVSSFFISSSDDYLSLMLSLIGTTSLICIAKGFVIGQILTVIFSVLYGIVSYHFAYYGEMITYLAMTAPIAVMTAIAWHKHPFEKSSQVAVSHVTKKQLMLIFLLAIAVTAVFYFLLKAFDTANLPLSTVSITTSFIAASLTLLRSPYYALGYMANDVVLIIMWILASLTDKSYFPMIVCFAVFLVNDFYGFISWNMMKKKQSQAQNIAN